MLEKKQKHFIHCPTRDMGLNNTPYWNKLLKARQIMLHNNLECKSSVLCIAWAWAEISSITINTACLHGGTAQRGIYLQIHLSNTADVTDCVSSDDKCLLLDGHAAGHVHDGKKKKMEVWQRRAQTNSWMDGRMDSWWCSTLFTFLFVLFLSVCLSLLPFICSGAEKTRSFPTPPPPKKGSLKTQCSGGS